jgi:hypothetical protein
LLVNATLTPGDFFVTTVNNLCPNTTYEFAAWMMKCDRFVSIMPNITFSIETTGGIVLQKFSTGDISVRLRLFGSNMVSILLHPASNNGIVLRMTNNAPVVMEMIIALDDITFRPCGRSLLQQYKDIPIPLMYVMVIRICTLLHQLFLLPIFLPFMCGR